MGATGNKGSGQAQIEAQPILNQRGRDIQPLGTLVHYPLALSEKARAESATVLNQILSDTMALRDLYKKYHWQVTGPTFYMLHLLFDKHFKEQVGLMDQLGERVQTLGGVTIASVQDVAETTKVPRPSPNREQVPVQISRLLEAHEIILKESHEAVRIAEQNRDDGTANLLASFVIPINEMQVWFLSAHLVDTPLVRAK